MDVAAGQVWFYRTPEGFDGSRIIIGAIASYGDEQRIICCSVTKAPQRQPDGSVIEVSIPFLPMTEQAFGETVTEPAGTDEPPTSFAQALKIWQDDPRGQTSFTVPFNGFLDQMIAHQMAAIVGHRAA